MRVTMYQSPATLGMLLLVRMGVSSGGHVGEWQYDTMYPASLPASTRVHGPHVDDLHVESVFSEQKESLDVTSTVSDEGSFPHWMHEVVHLWRRLVQADASHNDNETNDDATNSLLVDHSMNDEALETHGNETNHSATSNATNSRATSASTFCDSGMFMTMYMDGLHWSMLRFTGSRYDDSTRPRPPPQSSCLNYLVGSWALDSASKFRGAMMYSFLLAIVTEAVSAVRRLVTHTSGTSSPPPHRVVLLVLYAVQAWLGYGVMLVAMSFSIELILCVTMGLVTGHALFMHDDDLHHPAPRNDSDSVVPHRADDPPSNDPDGGLDAIPDPTDESDDNELGALLGDDASAAVSTNVSRLQRR